MKKILFITSFIILGFINPQVVFGFGLEYEATYEFESSQDATKDRDAIRYYVADGDYLYLNTGDFSDPQIEVLDISIPTEPKLIKILSKFDLSADSLQQEPVVQGGFMYINNYQELVVLDMSDPTSPIQVARVQNDELSGGGRRLVDGDTLYINFGYYDRGIFIYDISDPAAPVLQSHFGGGGVDPSLSTSGLIFNKFKDYLYITSPPGGNQSEVGYQTSAMKVLDVSDPTNPRWAHKYEGPEYYLFDWDKQKIGKVNNFGVNSIYRFVELSYNENGSIDWDFGISVDTPGDIYLKDGYLVKDLPAYSTFSESGIQIYDKKSLFDESASPIMISSDSRESLAYIRGLVYAKDHLYFVINGAKNDFGTNQLEIFSTQDHVYRFWSESLKAHFFTSSFSEKNSLIKNDSNWTYEGVAYKALTTGDDDVTPTYRFWSPTYQNHFYTNSINERNFIQQNDSNWTYEGEDFAVRKSSATGYSPVFRFYSEVFNGHFYTVSEFERDHLQANDSNWVYEGVAWYAPL